ncbi:hypothetical protein C8R44DRAFT_740598 [Mycena epipterygia]|nr:hypothetical protein C8R44DRAFT_740598 [Mycena epipterygia]
MSAPRRPAAMQYIDDSAQDADRDERPAFDDNSDEDEDSAEAEARRQDARDFDLPSILATHEPRLRASAPYRIPTTLLQAGAATPSRGEEIDMADLPPSCPVSPAFGFGALPAQMQMSRAATPAYMPAPDAPFSIPDSARAGNTSFHPLARGVPLHISTTSAPPRHSPADLFPNVAWDRLLLPQRNEGELTRPRLRPAQSHDTSTWQRRIPTRITRPTSKRSPKSKTRRLYLITNSLITSRATMMGNRPCGSSPTTMRNICTLSPPATTETRQRTYDRDAPAYARELRRSGSTFVVPDNAPARTGPSALPVVDHLVDSYDHEVRRAAETSKTSNVGTLVRNPRAPVIEQMPVGGWVRFRVGPNKGYVALLLSSTKILIARGVNKSCQPMELSRTVDSTQADRVTTPSVEDIVPFQASRHAVLRAAPFMGPCVALGEGDRVVVVGGEHSGKTGYIVMLRDVPVVNQSGHKCSAKYAKIQNQYDGTSLIEKRGPGFFVELGRLKRHLLDHPLPLQPLDRVRVVSGLVHRGLLGRAIEISGDQVQVEIPSPSNDTPGLHEGRIPETKCFDINVRYLSRNFECGDLVEVVRGLHENRVGMIVASCTGGGLEIFDGQDTTHNQMKTQLIRVCHQFKVRSADVKFVIFGDQNTPFASAYSAEYTQRSDISHPQLPPPPIFTPEQRQYREKQAEHYRSTLDIMGEDPGPCDEPTATKFEPTLEEILLQDKSRQERLDKLMRGHRRFEGYKVQAAFKTSHNKGSRGVVKAERNDRKRDARVASLALRNRRPDLNDVKGIVCHVQWDASIRRKTFPSRTSSINSLATSAVGDALPDTPPPGEKLWAATPPPPEPTLAGNHHVRQPNNEKQPQVARPRREKPQSLFLQRARPTEGWYKDSLTTKKVKVFRPGSDTANPLEVPPPTVKPRRTVADGTSIALVTQRVVIIGPETRPNPGDAQVYGANYVSVLVEGGDKYLYHTSSLCLAINEAIMESSASVF